MKKLIAFVIVAMIVGAGATAIYRFNFRKSIPQGVSVEEQVAAILVQNDCMVCHAHEPQIPFYANYPIVGERMKVHMTRAILISDLHSVSLDLQNIDEASLSKIEQAMLNESMPVLEYRLAHWGTTFNSAEKSILAGWIRDVRANRFATGLAAEEFANEPIQPLRGGIPVDSTKVVLGKKLFDDKRLSLDNTVSCADCHILADGGVSDPAHRTSKGIDEQFGGVNAPTVYNSVYNVQQFWNGRAATLAEQAAGPPVNPVEMGNQTWGDIATRLKADKALVKEFSTIYPEGITEASITDAIAEFEKTLTTPSSPFDKYLMGDKTAITAAQVAGYQLFKSYNCATCHTGQLMGGQSFERMGIFDDYFAARDPQITAGDDDKGLAGFTGNDRDMHKFKTPGLRNVAITAPYLHDGTAATLDDAVKSMLRFQTSRVTPQGDVDGIVDFLSTLTGVNPHLKK